MGTLELVRALVFDKRYDVNPISQQELKHTRWLPALESRNQIIFSLLAAALTFLGFIGIVASSSFVGSIPMFLNVALNLIWATPVSAVVAHAVQRERTGKTLQLLLTTPYSTEGILLAKAAGSFARISKIILSGLLALGWFGITINLLFIPIAVLNQKNPLLWGLIAIFATGILFIERIQELALATSIGMIVGSSVNSLDRVIIMTLILNFVTRVIQLAIMALFIHTVGFQGNTADPIWLNFMIGSPSVLIYAPGAASLGFIIVMVIVREVLIRAIVRRSGRQLLTSAA